MRIRTQLTTNAAALLTIALLAAASVHFARRHTAEAVASHRAADEILKGVFELQMITADHLLYGGARAPTRWQRRFDALTGVLDRAAPDLRGQETALTRMRGDLAEIGLRFDELAQRRGHSPIRPAGTADADEERLAAQIALRAKSLVHDTLSLVRVSHGRIERAQQMGAWILLGCLGLVFAQLLATLFVLRRSVLQPLETLTRGAAEVARGSLDHRVQLHRANEMGALAHAFNAMTDRLQTSIRSLQTEIAEREAAEERLALETEELSVTLEALTDAVIATDAEGRVRILNPAACRLTGWPAHEAQGQKLDAVLRLDDDRGRTDAPLAAPNTLRLRPAEGPLRDIALTRTAVRSHDGALRGEVLIFRDVSGARERDEEDIRLQKLESLGVLAGGIAHDFNNILTAILGSLSLALFDLDADAPSHSLIRDAEKATQRAKKLTEQLLTFSRGGAPVKQTARVEELIRESAGFALRGSNVAGEFDLAPDLWSADVDTGQISQVVQNLAINAKQAMPEGGSLRIVARNVRLAEGDVGDLPPGSYLRIEVIDSGVGIPEEQLGRIFDPYFTTKAEGTGLGLAIIHSIVRHHGGHISVASKLRIGTSFTLHLPANSAADPTAPPPVREEAAPPRTGRGKILVMDDEGVVGRIAGRMLNRLGYMFEIAVNGEHAIERFLHARERQQPFDLVILDLTIRGGMGGKEVVRTLREIDPTLKAVVSSGYSNDPILSQYRDYGFNGAIVKPYRFETLKSVVEQFIRPDPA